MLKHAILEKLTVLAEDRLNDDAFVLSVCSTVYKHLPLVIRRVTRCERCLRFLQYGKPFFVRRLQRFRAGRVKAPALSESGRSLQQTQPPASS